MKKLLVFIFLLTPLAVRALDVYQKIPLEEGIVLNVKKEVANRSFPHAYYEQAISSIPKIYPEHKFLAKRRYGKLGKVQYSIVCYKEKLTSDFVTISGIATYKDKAWFFETLVPKTAFGDGLLIVLEAVENFPLQQDITVDQ
ncbi:MAG: hypothetical protein OEY07_00790 [Gammaproteobacteria bacterium]|nr:hypothetical protein [Gammaproteobacteria bacterium]